MSGVNFDVLLGVLRLTLQYQERIHYSDLLMQTRMIHVHLEAQLLAYL